MALYKLTHAYYEGNYIWCTAFCDPYLYKVNIENGNIEQVINIMEKDDPLGAFMLIVPYKNYFIFLQSNTSKLVIMNRDNFEKEEFYIPNHNVKEIKLPFRFANAIVFGDNLYIWGISYTGIVKFNLLTKEVSGISDYLKHLKITYHNDELCNYDYIQISNNSL